MRKYGLLLFITTLLAGCAGPSRLLVKNCKDLGNGLYSCEEIPEKDLGVHHH